MGLVVSQMDSMRTRRKLKGLIKFRVTNNSARRFQRIVKAKGGNVSLCGREALEAFLEREEQRLGLNEKEKVAA